MLALARAAFSRLGREVLPETSIAVRPGEHWVVVGRNGAGKTTLGLALAGRLPLRAGTMRGAPAHHVSLANEARLLAREQDAEEDAAFAGMHTRGHTVADVLGGGPEVFGPLVRPLWGKHLKELSSGELRCVVLAKNLQRDGVVVLDEPMDGLDKELRPRMLELLGDAVRARPGLRVVLITHRLGEVPDWVTHFARCDAGRLVEARELRPGETGAEAAKAAFQSLERGGGLATDRLKALFCAAVGTDPPVCLENASVVYDGRAVLDRISWTVGRGEQWVVRGPTGSGKTTLMRLVTGDEPQGHGVALTILGRPRSAWPIFELREHVGYVSPSLHLQFLRRCPPDTTVVEVLESGFFGSVGLFVRRRVTDDMRSRVQCVAELLRIENLLSGLFRTLSQGQQRLVLIGRALVIGPQLLLLDEAMAGLDVENRRRILDMIAAVASVAHVVAVSHFEEELDGMAAMTHVMDMPGGVSGLIRVH